jgi:F-box associated protein
MVFLLSLPDDILIMICTCLELMDLYNMRLVTRRLATLISSYNRTIAPRVAQNTFPGAKHMLQTAMSEAQDLDITWLNSLVIKYLSAVLVDRIRLESEALNGDHMGIRSEDERGDIIRTRVENGWRVYKVLSDLSKNVYGMQNNQIPPRSMKQQVKQFWRSLIRNAHAKSIDSLERRERLIFQRREAYLRSLEQQEIVDYRLTQGLLHCMIKTKYDPSHIIALFMSGVRTGLEEPDYFDWAEKTRGEKFRRGESWVNWCLLHEGPKLFWVQWHVHGSDQFVKERLIQAWEERSEQQITIERRWSSQLEKIIRFLDGVGRKTVFGYISLNDRRDLFWGHPPSHPNNRPPCDDIMNDVPYRVLFRINLGGFPGEYPINVSI